ncbi:hypothetical protein TNCV_3696981 [Trichonephila clavipes]|uniref:Uncharacterized protein n=1 Tax=Trichonephila clavipes TaxID=2585209 RepID=A0A8X6SCJ5_TRICX|nr:hypothetical protein TNCV_3696981 [Trichonephila clavipes]
MRVEKNNVVIWKGGKPLTVNVNQVQIYPPRDRDEDDVEIGRSSDEGIQAAQGKYKGREGPTRKENTKVQHLQGKRSSGASSTLPNEMQPQEVASKVQRRPQEKQNVLKRAPPSSLQEDRTNKRRPQESLNWKKMTAPETLQSGPRSKRRPRGNNSNEI